MTAEADTRLRRLPDKGRKDIQLARDIIALRVISGEQPVPGIRFLKFGYTST